VQAVDLARELGVEGLEYEADMTRKMEAYTAFLMKPDASLPLLGDTGLARDEGWREQKLAALAPERPSQAFPWSGLYAMRSGWESGALYLFFTTGPYGIMHNHQDHLSFEVSGYGTPLIVEPGITPYGRTEQRERLASSPAHNCLTVDGLGQHRAHVEPSGPVDSAWFTGPALDFAEGRFDEGFGPERQCPVAQVRSVLFVKPEYFLVVDRVVGEGTHDLQWHFMFHSPSLQVQEAARRAVSLEARGANVSLAWSDPQLRGFCVSGEVDFPYRGLMTADGDRPTSSLYLERRADLPISVAFAVEPLAVEATPALSVEPMAAEGGVAFAVRGQPGRLDVVLLSGGTALGGRAASDGLATVFRLSGDRLETAMAAGASEVTYDGRPVAPQRAQEDRE
jgi:hypothetical protein